MKLIYPNKSQVENILCNDNTYILNKKSANNDNILIYGENFYSLKALLYDFNMYNQIDLVYIDPPFATNNTFKITDKRANTISSYRDSEIAYKDDLLGSDYLEFLRKRLIVIKELMSKKSSIYLHIDYKIGHYVKIIMDEVFGIENFRNDITRIKCNPKNFKRNGYGNIKDMILFYTKTDHFIWNEPFEDYSEIDIKKLFSKIDKKGRRYTTVPLHAPGETLNGDTGKSWRGMFPPKGRHWRVSPKELDLLDREGLIEWSNNGNPRKIIYENDRAGKRKQDIWTYKDPQYPNYPTEKNIELLKSIINTSSNENSLVLDCFCGSGTTLEASSLLSRRYIGIDKSEKAIKVARKRLDGIKENIFAKDNKYQFLELSHNKLYEIKL